MATDKVQNKITETKSNIANKATTFVKDTIQKYVPNTEVSITGAEDAKPQWEIITVQPIRDIGDDLTFFQGSLLRWDGDRDTINLGIGQRRFLMDKTIMIGANAFYDHEFSVDHSRLGLGGEFLTSVGEFRINNYYANSNQRLNAGSAEEAMSGSEYEFGTHVPYIPKLKVFGKKFNWDNERILSTGIDVPGLNSIMVLSEIDSVTSSLQILGRAMRGPKNGGNKSNTVYLTKDNKNTLENFNLLEDKAINT